jgi:hypothetical protein
MRPSRGLGGGVRRIRGIGDSSSESESECNSKEDPRFTGELRSTGLDDGAM